ncbi:uncharacterized protein LOC113337746, partial [Papaver somniferum]|uniref:uncharacterized protein LOC113337746 n=1 Tax=Papaver somniferum TaxID=3469 RepID=UPI000E6FDCCC
MKELWFLRNDCTYGNEKCDINATKKRIMKGIFDSDTRMKACMWNSQYDLKILKLFVLKTRRVKRLIVKEVYFHLPSQGKLLLCCDGASRGNPGISGYGIVGRTYTGEFVVAISGGIGISTNFYAEVIAILVVGEWVVHNGFLELIFRTDSQEVRKDLYSKNLPWFAITRWEKICDAVVSWSFTHSYREVNFSADNMANKGVVLSRGEQR